jgi:thiamine biosynthesis lipoprotein
MIHGFRFTALGSTGRIRIANVAEATASRAVSESVRWLRDVEPRLSRFRDDSLIARLNRGESVNADADLMAVLAAADRAHRLTAGRYDATALPLWRMWHDPSRTTWPTTGELADVQAAIGWDALERTEETVRLTRSGMALDLGGVGKEWCVDQVLARLVMSGCADVLVELGGDCAARGAQPGRDGWFVLLPGAAAALEIRDEAIATSGIGTRRRMLAGRAVSHLIDVRTGHPATGIIRSATVLAPACLTAGIHASDLCLLEEVTSEAIAERSHGLATWMRASDGTVLADPRLVARVHPVASDTQPRTSHVVPRTSHLLSA